MKVLHVNNIAGVPSLLVGTLRENGIKADLVVRNRHKYGFHYEKEVDTSARRFLMYVLKLGRRYDIIHVHGFEFIQHFNIDVISISTMRIFQKKVVLHLHGTDIRMNFRKLRSQVAMKTPNRILVSTPDLLAFSRSATWLPNPVDTETFKPLGLKRHGALFLSHWYEPQSEELVRRKCQETGLELTVVNPKETYMPYHEMPLFLNKFEVFFDRFTIHSLSKTALEALACGCKVIGWKGPVANPKKVVENHALAAVTKKLIKVYEDSLSSHLPMKPKDLEFKS